MRVPGLATGMDIEQMVNKLMEAERMPLRRLEQDRTLLTWKQEAYRELNLALSELDQMMLDMKLSRTYESKSVHSTQENAVTATGSSQTANGTYYIEVEQLATAAMNVGTAGVDVDAKIKDLNSSYIDEEIIFYTYDENGDRQDHKIKIEEDDTIGDILKKINDDKSIPVRAFAQEIDGETKVILEATRTGIYNHDKDGYEIVFGNSNEFFSDILKLDQSKESGAQNAKFTYNHHLDIESRNNSYTINGLNLQFNDKTNGAATLTVTNDVDHAFEKIMDFVNKYNEVIEKLNGTQQERRYRDYPPLTQEQKEEMTEREIELWEERAKSGLIRGERVIVDGMASMRRSWYETTVTDGAYKSITQIGITTSEDYLDGGKLIVDEEKLKQALRENPEDVRRLFAENSDGHQGVIHKLEDAVKRTIDRIHDHAGRATSTLDNYALGKRMKDLDKRIEDFQRRLINVENRYWNQFTQMEKAIQRLNEQSSYMFAQFYGDM